MEMRQYWRAHEDGEANVLSATSQGQVVDLYVPRKCSATNRLITAKDHASVQINVGEVDEEGKLTGTNVTYAFHGGVRQTGDSDDSLNRCASSTGGLPAVY